MPLLGLICVYFGVRLGFSVIPYQSNPFKRPGGTAFSEREIISRGRTYVMITYVSKENYLGPDD